MTEQTGIIPARIPNNVPTTTDRYACAADPQTRGTSTRMFRIEREVPSDPTSRQRAICRSHGFVGKWQDNYRAAQRSLAAHRRAMQRRDAEQKLAERIEAAGYGVEHGHTVHRGSEEDAHRVGAHDDVRSTGCPLCLQRAADEKVAHEIEGLDLDTATATAERADRLAREHKAPASTFTGLPESDEPCTQPHAEPESRKLARAAQVLSDEADRLFEQAAGVEKRANQGIPGAADLYRQTHAEAVDMQQLALWMQTKADEAADAEREPSTPHAAERQLPRYRLTDKGEQALNTPTPESVTIEPDDGRYHRALRFEGLTIGYIAARGRQAWIAWDERMIPILTSGDAHQGMWYTPESAARAVIDAYNAAHEPEEVRS